MKVLLVDSVSVGEKFSHEVSKGINEKFANSEVLTHTCPTDYDIPFYISRKLSEQDAAIVFLTHARDEISMNKINMVLSKLIDLEVEKQKPVHKVSVLWEGEPTDEERSEMINEVVSYCLDLLKGESPERTDTVNPESEAQSSFVNFF